MSVMALARDYHAGQVDKAGSPYWMHCQRVMTSLLAKWPEAPREQVQAAALHDVLEDTLISREQMEQDGVLPAAIAIIARVTRIDHGIGYLEWISAIAASGDIGAVRVKLCDVLDNSDPERRPRAAGFQERVATKYGPAADILRTVIGKARPV